jgi:hypothetical protein
MPFHHCSSPICKRHPESMLKGIKSYLCLVQTGHVDIEEFRCGRKGERHTTCNIVWNMERDHSFWITSSEHQGTMPKRIFSFSCSMQVIQFCQIFQNLDDKCKLIWILNNEDPIILRYLCQYLLSTTI